MTTLATDTVAEIVSVLRETGFVALTGAGMSTDSGIPDYRGPSSTPRTPMTYQEFVATRAAQQHYWARSYVGWARMRHAEPNAGHLALARLQQAGVCRALITQNVDGLHESAGSRACALHGRIAEVVCLGCGATGSRDALQQRMHADNPKWLDEHRDAVVRPDGDVLIEDTHDFVPPRCGGCGGVLKPDVVFFGENVPKPRVQHCYDLVDAAPALLVLGSSLTVMSGLRFVRYAAKRGLRVVIVNRGATRGDALAAYRLDHGTSEFLTHPTWLV